MKNINHFVLPEHTNSLYQKEAISSISLTRDVAEKINELVDAYNDLSKMDLKWKQTQEGEYRKAIIYIKDNLINTLHDLTEMLENEGYFDKTIAEYTKLLESRIDNLLGKVKEGTSTMDAEIIDLRVSEHGITYECAGDAVRYQMRSKANVDGTKEITPQNLQIVEIIRPNFFNMLTAKMTPIYGAFSQGEWLPMDVNSAILNYASGAQYSLELDNSAYKDVFIRIESDKPMFWVRLTDAEDNTQGSTLGTETTLIETARNIETNKYLVFYVQENTTIKVHVNAGSEYTDYKIYSKYLPNSVGVMPWEGKKVLCLGDSITANTNAWVDGLKNNLNLAQITNAGVGGTTIANNGTNNYFVKRVDASYANYDCIFVMGGTNDEGQSIAIGDITSNNTTFKGALVELIKAIQNYAPNASIIFGTPVAGRGTADGSNNETFTKNGKGLTTVDYVNAMKEVCSMFGIPCIDVYSECGINPFNRSQYIEDSVHPNTNGQYKILEVLTNGFNAHKIRG